MPVKEIKIILRRMEELYNKVEFERDLGRKNGLRKLFLSTAKKFKKEVERL